MKDSILIILYTVMIFLNVAMVKWFHNNNLSRFLSIVAIILFVIGITHCFHKLRNKNALKDLVNIVYHIFMVFLNIALYTWFNSNKLSRILFITTICLFVITIIVVLFT